MDDEEKFDASTVWYVLPVVIVAILSPHGSFVKRQIAAGVPGALRLVGRAGKMALVAPPRAAPDLRPRKDVEPALEGGEIERRPAFHVNPPAA